MNPGKDLVSSIVDSIKWSVRTSVMNSGYNSSLVTFRWRMASSDQLAYIVSTSIIGNIYDSR